MKVRISVLVPLFFLSFIVILQQALSVSASTKNPMVVFEPVRCDSGSMDYVGKAITRMLVTRLSSEGIDTIVPNDNSEMAKVSEVADFVITGTCAQNGQVYESSFQLRSPKENKVIRSWNLRDQNLGVMARDVSLLSAKMADVIKNSGQLLISDTASNLVPFSSTDSKKVKMDDEFEMARMHPDILVRERLEKDEEREIRQQRKGRSGYKPSYGGTASENEDSYMPLPDVYDEGDDYTKGDEKQKEVATGTTKKDDDGYDSFFPVPDVYDPGDDEGPAQKEKVAVKAEQQDGGKKYQATPSGSAVKGKGGKEQNSWYSWLWPFGKDQDDKRVTVSQAKETRLEKEKAEAEKHTVVVQDGSNLPIPPPPKVDFNIPEPVPLDQALSKIKDIQVEKRNKRGWLSWLWPWGEEEAPEKIVPSTSGSEAVAKNSSGSPTVYESTSQIETMRRHPGYVKKNMGKTSLHKGVESGENLESNGQEGSGDSMPSSSSVSRPQDVEGPIWQWN